MESSPPRGLKDDAKTYGELIFDVNSAYFYNHGGYEFAKLVMKKATVYRSQEDELTIRIHPNLPK